MVFSFDIETPASTPRTTPQVTTLPISGGIIRQWYINFPDGNWFEAPLRIHKEGTPILPINLGGEIRGNGAPFVSIEFINISTPPWELTALTWNEDINNPHDIYVSITIMPLWTLLPYSDQLLNMMTAEEIKMVF